MQEWTKAQFAHPEIKTMLHTVGSQRRARQAIHGVQVARTRSAFNDSQRRHTFIIKHLFTDKLLAPVGVFDFPAQPGVSP